MESSEEICRVVERWVAAIAAGDVDAVLGRLSHHMGALGVGSDPDEWWRGDEAFAIWPRQIEEAGPIRFEVDEVEAWEEGTVGWAAARVRVDTGDATRDARITCVLHLERGDWKVVQHHTSFGQPNEQVYGAALTVTIDQLKQAVRRDRPDLSDTSAADGTVTIVFTDVVDSTVLNERLGDYAWRDVLRRLRARTADATAKHGGRMVETIGDGSMLAFPSARRAVACARELQVAVAEEFADASPPVRVRIGVHTGEALREGNEFFGATLNYAARVTGHALGGEVVVSSLVRQLVADNTRFHDAREVELKGFAGTHTVYAVDLR